MLLQLVTLMPRYKDAVFTGMSERDALGFFFLHAVASNRLVGPVRTVLKIWMRACICIDCRIHTWYEARGNKRNKPFMLGCAPPSA